MRGTPSSFRPTVVAGAGRALRPGAFFIGLLFSLAAVAGPDEADTATDGRPQRPPAADRFLDVRRPSDAPPPPDAGPIYFEPCTRSPALPGVGARLRAALRDAPRPNRRVVVRGLRIERLQAYGVQLRSCLGPICTVTAPQAALRQATQWADFIDLPQPLRLQLRASGPDIGIDQVHQGDGLVAAHRGQGARIALYDTGIDFEHPIFLDAAGEPRVTAVWDQRIPGAPPPGFTDGTWCDGLDIKAGRCPSRDRHGHGTYTAGILASGDRLDTGMAPEANIIAAASDDFEGFVEALAWFEAVGAADPGPMVVNLSLGGHEGPHDGTSMECEAIDALSHPVVVAAGNEGDTPIHAAAELDGEAWLGLRFGTRTGTLADLAVVDIWGDPGARLEASWILYDDAGTVVASSTSAQAGGPGATDALIIDGQSAAELTLDGTHPDGAGGQKPHLRLAARVAVRLPSQLRLGVRLRGEGTFDAWVDTPAAAPAIAAFATDGRGRELIGDSERSVNELATAARAIAVSAYRLGGDGVRRLASFSAHPSDRPEMALDLAAPGVAIHGPGSLDAPGGRRGRLASGTSAASPHVAGLLAVALSAAPTNDRDQLPERLVASADRSRLESGDDPRWGHGAPDAPTLLALVAGTEEGCLCTHRTPRRASGSTAAAGLLLLALAVRPRRRRTSPDRAGPLA